MSETPIDPRITAAQLRADSARARLGATVGELRHRVSPHTLAQDAAETLKEQGRALAASAVDTAQRQPMTVAVVAGSIVLFLARRRIAGLFRRATPGADARSSFISDRKKKGPAR